MELSTSSPEFVSVSTPLGTKQMTLAPFGSDTQSNPKSRKKSRQKKRKVDEASSSMSSSSSSSSSSPSKATTTAPASSPSNGSWAKNLQRRGGFWGDAYWYDLQLEKRLLLAKPMLTELVLALPPCGDKTVLDLCAGSGRASAAILEAYPTVKLVLVDSSEQRLTMASQRLEAVQQGVKERMQLVTKVVTLSATTQLCDEPVDVVVACLAFHVLTEKPAHYAQAEEEKTVSVEEEYEELFRAVWRALRPGGHVVFADHVGQLSLFKQLKTLEKAGFEDVDCAWRQDDSFVAGGRKPLA
ncbi:hypothetical protein PC129_g11914 [Phytophthora cactorum]|uniref:Methyltransferase type 12 domain-containing protein n=1 Tax=Phytophthora cactorum TaxID=29920 RepID=A0A329SKH1_9STRA|nr:hypothetical protein Pcac1_g12271 [Phytophthora cactorum]KAG2815853.1 hypothetical protein PC112_g13697 [Phytophthora cactorum]KAG2817704.1 hypothetical protein PC111_g12602 [Phytophthora cactorum]KAG2853580.1 hypothetical protein PC113_g14058 [Phytophthora cactorum]KAG2903127.1 hypothetical protein PC114_g12397 [Phytophthora cactorum]